MECQPQSNLVQDAKPQQQNISVKWATSMQAVGSRLPKVGASMEQPLASSVPTHSKSSLERNLTQIILTSQSPQEALSGLARRIGEAFLTDHCLIVAQANHQATSHITYWHSDTVTPFNPPDILQPLLNHPAIQSPLETTEPIAVTDLLAISPQQGTGSGKKFTKKVASAPQPSLSPIRAVLLLRTQFQGQANGSIILLQTQPYAWKESDVQLLKTLSPQVAITLSQTHLEQQVQQQIRYQNLNNQLTVAIRNNWDVNRTFQLAVEGAVAALQASRGMLLLFKYTDPLHRHRASKGIPKTKAKVVAEWSPGLPTLSIVQENKSDAAVGIDGNFWASDCCLCQQILLGNGEPVTTPARKLSTDADTSSDGTAVATVFGLEKFPSLLLVPLENQGTILGCLVLQHQQLHRWSTEETAFVKLTAAQLSTAIIQSRTLQQIQSVVQERTAQLQRSLEVQAKLYEKTRQQVEQLRRLNEEREEFLSTVSHELRTPLTSMTLAIRMLRQADLSDDRREKYLDILEQQCVQETQLINDLLALRKLESNTTTTQFQKLDIRYLIRDTVQSFEDSLADRGLKLELDLPNEPLMIQTEADSFSRILVELLTNAKKYSEPGSVVRLQVTDTARSNSTQPLHNLVTLKLQNMGSGIAPEELPHIFDKFRRGQGVTKQAIQGTGLGLALVKGLVEHLGGTIAASSQPQEQEDLWQTCFTVNLPKSPEVATIIS